MTLSEKRRLISLLQQYQDEQIEASENNKQELKIANLQGKHKWEADVTFGIKAQYEHARIISAKLSKEINQELPSYWAL